MINGHKLTRRQAVLTVAGAMILVLVVAFAGAYWIALSAANQAIGNSASVVQLCKAGNESRAQQRQLWHFLLTLAVRPPHETSAQQAERQRRTKALEAYIGRTFAPRDCATYRVQ